MKPKKELIRIVKNGNETVLDIYQKLEGRGAYICKNEECIDVAKKRRSLSKHFKTAVDDSIYDAAKAVTAGE
jgi:predicted RNA-binding protein YlxR (DUF448 family)